MRKGVKCRACGRILPSQEALKDHNKTKHRGRGFAFKSLYLSLAVGLVAYSAYSGILGWFMNPASPSIQEEGQEDSNQVGMHIHVSLKIIIDGKQVPIPSDVGIGQALWKDRSLDRFGEMAGMSPLHTHDDTGTIHVESKARRDFTLGDFFAVWGVKFNESCIFERCSPGAVIMTVNGVRSMKFGNHVLKDGEFIRIELGKT